MSLKIHIWISHSTWISLSLLFKRKLYIWNWHNIVCSISKESACTEGDLGSVPWLGGSPGEGNGNLLQYSHLENHIDRGAWWATIHGVARVRHDLVTKQQHAPHTLVKKVRLRKVKQVTQRHRASRWKKWGLTQELNTHQTHFRPQALGWAQKIQWWNIHNLCTREAYALVHNYDMMW